MDAQQHGRQLEVDEEDHDSEVDECVWDRNPFRLLINHEDQSCRDASFRRTASTHMSEHVQGQEETSYSQCGTQDFDGFRSPDSSEDTLRDFEKSGAVSFNGAHDGHDQVAVRVDFSRVSDTVVYLFAANHLLHAGKDEFAWRELADLVEEVERRVEDEVPDERSEKDVVRALESAEDRFS